jgi:hypothetical protein
MSDTDTMILAALDRLTTEATSLRTDFNTQTGVISAQTKQIKNRTRALWAAVALAVLALAVLALVVADNSRAIAKNNLRLCPIVSLLIPQPGDAAPSTDRGREVTLAAIDLYHGYGCAN